MSKLYAALEYYLKQNPAEVTRLIERLRELYPLVKEFIRCYEILLATNQFEGAKDKIDPELIERLAYEAKNYIQQVEKEVDQDKPK